MAACQRHERNLRTGGELAHRLAAEAARERAASAWFDSIAEGSFEHPSATFQRLPSQ